MKKTKFYRPANRLVTLLFGLFSAVQVVLADPVSEAAEGNFGEESLLSESDLSSQRGQGLKYTALSNAQLSGNVINVGSGGSVNNGANSISNHAFDNVNGIPTVVQNSGNNVIIQSSTIVNLTFEK